MSFLCVLFSATNSCLEGAKTTPATQTSIQRLYHDSIAKNSLTSLEDDAEDAENASESDSLSQEPPPAKLLPPLTGVWPDD